MLFSKQLHWHAVHLLLDAPLAATFLVIMSILAHLFISGVSGRRTVAVVDAPSVSVVDSPVE